METMELNAFRNVPVLITGGTGFVGSHLSEALCNLGANVVSTYQSIDRRSYFFWRQLDVKIVLREADVADSEKIRQIVSKFQPRFIFHLAAQSLVETAYYEPEITLKTNIMGTISVLEALRHFPFVKGIILASSDKAYGKMQGTKYKESDPLKGDHPYEVSKASADLIATSYSKTYGVPIITTRFGNIYGEGDTNFSRIIPGIMKAVVLNEKLPLRSDGTFVRDYIYIKDVVRGYILLAQKIDRCKGEAYNFGSEETLSVLDAVRIVEKALGINVKTQILNNEKNEIPKQSLSYEKVQRAIDWSPKFTLRGTAKKIFAYYQSYFEMRNRS